VLHPLSRLSVVLDRGEEIVLVGPAAPRGFGQGREFGPEVAASLHDSPLLKITVAQHYEQSLNGVEEDCDSAEVWFSLAAESGWKVAIDRHNRFKRKRMNGR
jgi:hypothetical protein